LIRLRRATASLVLVRDSAESEITSGTSLTLAMRCPLAIKREGKAEAAKEEATANLLWFLLTFLCQRRKVLVGANIRPERHMLPKAAWPARPVPPPETRGIRETARPVPQDSAECWWPASRETAYGWRLFLAMLVWTKWTISGRIVARKTVGRATFSSFSPSLTVWTWTNGRDAYFFKKNGFEY